MGERELNVCLNINEILGIMFSIGAIIEESQGQHDKNNYLSERKCSRARSLVVLKWTVIGFFLTMSYKSVLRAILMKTDYEDPIDTIDDVLQSDRQFMYASDTIFKEWIENDPREKVQALAKRAKRYNVGANVASRRIAIE